MDGKFEERLRPGKASQAGFLGREESLTEVLAMDAATLEEVGVDCLQIADALEHLLTWGLLEHHLATMRSLLEQAVAKPGDASLARIFEARGVTDRAGTLGLLEMVDPDPKRSMGKHQLSYTQWRGYQACPWGCFWDSDELRTSAEIALLSWCRSKPLGEAGVPHRLGYASYASIDFALSHVDTGAEVGGPGLIVHLIREHQFFEGRGSRYRTEPAALCAVLGLAPRRRSPA